jgi:hypothetical protein
LLALPDLSPIVIAINTVPLTELDIKQRRAESDCHPVASQDVLLNLTRPVKAEWPNAAPLTVKDEDPEPGLFMRRTSVVGLLGAGIPGKGIPGTTELSPRSAKGRSLGMSYDAACETDPD